MGETTRKKAMRRMRRDNIVSPDSTSHPGALGAHPTAAGGGAAHHAGCDTVVFSQILLIYKISTNKPISNQAKKRK